MQLKIINIQGQCRGRPPAKGKSREGPGNTDFAFRILHFAFRIKRLRNQKSEMRNVKPRDWISFTCSESQIVRQNRDKDRWNERVDLLLFQRGGGRYALPGKME
jgi:hypothetical protein